MDTLKKKPVYYVDTRLWKNVGDVALCSMKGYGRAMEVFVPKGDNGEVWEWIEPIEGCR